MEGARSVPLALGAALALVRFVGKRRAGLLNFLLSLYKMDPEVGLVEAGDGKEFRRT